MKKFFLSTVLFSCIFFNAASCQSESYWAKTYGGVNTETAYAIQQTADSGFIVAGSTSSFGTEGDCWVIKLDNNGNVSWEKTYGGSNADLVQSIQQTTDGCYVMAGRTYSFGSGNGDVWVLKLGSSGSVIWQKTYGGNSEDISYFIQQTTDGGYIVAGITRSYGAGNWDYLILKLDEYGDVSWQKTYGKNGSDVARMIRQTTDGGYIVAGYTRSSGAGSYDYWLLKLDSTGNTAWQKTYGGNSDDYSYSIRQTTDGGYIVAGETRSFGAGNSDFWVLKLDSNGNVTWQKTYGGSSEDFTYSIWQTIDGDYVAGGFTQSFGAGSYDYWVLKLDDNGNIVWQKTYGLSNNEGVLSIQQTADKGYIVAGPMRISSASDADFGVLKIDGSGDIPSCNLIGSSNAVLSGLTVSGINTNVTGQVSHLDVIDTVITSQDSSAEVAIICEKITLIELSSFNAYPSNKEVLIKWVTESETDNAGFNLYRCASREEEYIKINDCLIPASGSPTEGSFYEIVDEDVENRKTYCYKLEDIDINGKSTLHEPVCATPRFIFDGFTNPARRDRVR